MSDVTFTDGEAMSAFVNEIIECCWEDNEEIPTDELMAAAWAVYDRLRTCMPLIVFDYYAWVARECIVIDPYTRHGTRICIMVRGENEKEPVVSVLVYKDDKFQRIEYAATDEVPNDELIERIFDCQ